MGPRDTPVDPASGGTNEFLPLTQNNGEHNITAAVVYGSSETNDSSSSHSGHANGQSTPSLKSVLWQAPSDIRGSSKELKSIIGEHTGGYCSECFIQLNHWNNESLGYANLIIVILSFSFSFFLFRHR